MIDKLLAVILENKREGEERWGGRRGMVKNTVRQQRQNRKQSKQHQQENPMVAFMCMVLNHPRQRGNIPAT